MAKAKKRSASKRSGKKAAPRKGARRAAARSKRPAAKRAAPPGLDAVARRIVRATEGGSFGPAEMRALYHEDCTSEEATGQVDRGLAGLEAKGKRWDQMQSGSKWKARNVWTGKGAVCVEWDGTVNLRDGRTVQLREVAIHQIRNGKIQSERYYYNPMTLMPPGQGGGAKRIGFRTWSSWTKWS